MPYADGTVAWVEITEQHDTAGTMALVEVTEQLDALMMLVQ